MERRDRKSLDLARNTQTTRCGGNVGHVSCQTQKWLENRWAKIGLRAQNKNAVFDNLVIHINVDSVREAFNALEGFKARLKYFPLIPPLVEMKLKQLGETFLSKTNKPNRF